MPEAQCIRIPLHPEAADEFIAFVRDLAHRRSELITVLREEGMLSEAVLLERSADGASLVLFTKAESLQRAHEVLAASTHPVQARMRELSARAFDLSRATQLEVLLDMTGRFDALAAQ